MPDTIVPRSETSDHMVLNAGVPQVIDGVANQPIINAAAARSVDGVTPEQLAFGAKSFGAIVNGDIRLNAARRGDERRRRSPSIAPSGPRSSTRPACRMSYHQRAPSDRTIDGATIDAGGVQRILVESRGLPTRSGSRCRTPTDTHTHS